MDLYRLHEGLFVAPTPIGAYHAVASVDETSARVMLRALLTEPETPGLDLPTIERLTRQHGTGALDLFAGCQDRGWIEGHGEPSQAATGALENVLPRALAALSEDGHALLADAQGFCISSVGFSGDAGVELSALSADLATLHARRGQVMRAAVPASNGAWAVVDAVGNSRVGFWPLFIGSLRFVLVIGGMPHLNHPQLVQLIWVLSVRYGTDDSPPGRAHDLAAPVVN